MSRIDPSSLAPLQRNTDKIRNFCILAHVDHGKTTLSDSLISSNGIISSKLAGKLRFLDSTEEEQKRGITMHSSAISLFFRMSKQQESAASAGADVGVVEEEDFLINLVDSPGHIDFSSDVSTATRLCDGALIVVDVLEGICTQTHAVVYKALRERLRPCLVLNKIDRLAVEMRLSTVEAFHHLRRLVENVNALAFTLLNSELLLQIDDEQRELQEHLVDDEPLLAQWTFSPEKGNVVFAAALDCWGFGISKFVGIWSAKLGVNKSVLRKYIFDDYAINPATKKLVKCNATENPNVKPMFATMILDPIWQMYDVCIHQQNPEKAAKMAARGLGVEVEPREVNKRDPRITLQAILRRWLPLADTVLRMVARCMPSPVVAQRDRSRLGTLLPVVLPAEGNCNTATSESDELELSVRRCQDCITSCVSETQDAPAPPVIVFVSKMISVRMADLSKKDFNLILNSEIADNVQNSSGEPAQAPYEKEVFLALARVYSGVLTSSTPLHVLGNRHDPFTYKPSDSDLGNEIPVGSIGLYIMLGPSIFPVESVPAGNIVGIIGLEKHVLKTATLSTTLACYPLRAMTFQSQPIVKVAIEPLTHRDLVKLEKGLQALYQVDPAVEIGVDASTGQHTMMCLGELHLEQCVKMLKEKFARCELQVSQPLVSFRETVVPCDDSFTHILPPPWSAELAKNRSAVGGRATLSLPFNASAALESLSICFKCTALPPPCITALVDMDSGSQTSSSSSSSSTKFSDFIAHYHKSCEENAFSSNGSSAAMSELDGHYSSIQSSAVEDLWKTDFNSRWRNLYQELSTENRVDMLGKSGSDTRSEAASDFLLRRVLAVGPRSTGSNVLVLSPEVYISIDDGTNSQLMQLTLSRNAFYFWKIWYRLHNSVVAGFELCCSSGPLMQEPVHGVAFIVEFIKLPFLLCSEILNRAELEALSLPSTTSDVAVSGGVSSTLSGQMIAETRDCLRTAMLSGPVRVVEPIYDCNLQCEQAQLGNLYSVLAKRRGEVYKEDIIEGTSLFVLSAHLAVSESFGFAQELLKKTSGSGTTPQLKFSHWDVIPQDPFWRPVTEDELEEFGENATAEHNLPRVLIDQVRKRKGLPIEEKIVVFAEKQRTLNKKK